MWTLINLVNLCLWILVKVSFKNLTRGVPGFCLVFIFSSLSCSAFSCILSLASELPHNNDEGDGILQRSRLNWISSQFHLQINVWMCSTRRSRFYWLIYMSIFLALKGVPFIWSISVTTAVESLESCVFSGEMANFEVMIEILRGS